MFANTCLAARHDEIAGLISSTFASKPGGDRVVKNALEMMDQCIAYRAHVDPEIRGWLGGVKIPRPPTPPKKKP